MQKQILRRRDVCDFTGLSYSTIYRLEQLNRFPKRRLLGETAVGWLKTEVETWANERIAINPKPGEVQ
jgi:prophage regulatory protein